MFSGNFQAGRKKKSKNTHLKNVKTLVFSSLSCSSLALFSFSQALAGSRPPFYAASPDMLRRKMKGLEKYV
jgi:hypothetical protein